MTLMDLWAKDYSPARMAHDSCRGIILGESRFERAVRAKALREEQNQHMLWASLTDYMRCSLI